MLRPVSIAGVASLVAVRLPDTLEAVIHATIVQAVREAGLHGVDAIDLVVTVASDVLDGIMVPPRSEIAASVGRQYLDVPSSAGHALAAAAVMIESGQVGDVLLVGWGEGHKLAGHDSRFIQSDPFYARPVGGVPAALAALQAQRLLAGGRHREDALDAYVALMHRRADVDRVEGGVADDPAGVPRWLRTRWVDGVAALVLSAQPRTDRAVRLVDVATASRGSWPLDGELDPARWIREAVHRRDGSSRPVAETSDVIEVGANTPVCELFALDAFGAGSEGTPAYRRAGVNVSGGGAVACFGPASGLSRVIAAARALVSAIGPSPRSATVADLAGPIGQQVTVARLERSGG